MKGSRKHFKIKVPPITSWASEHKRTRNLGWAPKDPAISLGPRPNFQSNCNTSWSDLCLHTACSRSAQTFTGDAEMSVLKASEPQREKKAASLCHHTGGTYSPGGCAWCPRRPRRGWSGSIVSPQCLQGSDPCSHWSYNEKDTAWYSEEGKL